MTCLTPHCQHFAIRRGLCQKHYENRRKSVAAGVLFWDDLIVAGLALPYWTRRPERTATT